VYCNQRWYNPHKGSSHRKFDGTSRHIIHVNKCVYYVYQLVCRAFNGPQLPNTTCDHIDRNTSNNKSENLCWKTRSQQIENQRLYKRPNSTGTQILIRNLDWPPSRKWETFPSFTSAASFYGVDGSGLSQVAKNKITAHKRFIVKLLPPEPQDDLEAGDDSNLFEPPPTNPPYWCRDAGESLQKEEWKMAPDVTNILVSTRGRVRTKNPSGCTWGFKRTPIPCAGMTYAEVYYKSRPISVHILVWITFMGPVPPGKTIDHKLSQRKFDNRLCNIRAISKSEQAKNRIIAKGCESAMRAIEARPISETTWERFDGVNKMLSILRERFPDTKFDRKSVVQRADNSAEYLSTAFHGWVFRWPPS
jgi:hypothetical protein